jgi:hypothetical protein
MELIQYQQEAHKFANYMQGEVKTNLIPDKYINRFNYPEFCLISETGELIGKFSKVLRGDNVEKQDITKEVGDCIWSFCEVLSKDNISIELLPDIEYNETDLERILEDLVFFSLQIKRYPVAKIHSISCYYSAIVNFCVILNFDFWEVLQENIDKLTDRVNRGVIKSSGDNR